MGGIVGMLRSIGMNIRDFNPTKCIIVFDGKGGSMRRKKIFPDYKSGRTGNNVLRREFFTDVEEEKISMRRQMVRTVQYLDLLPVQIFCIDNIEADDAIAYMTMQYFKPKNSKVRIVSTDRDFLQLVDENIEVYSPIKKKIYNETQLKEEFGIHSNNYLLYRILSGDSSDNIPGIKGIGLKTLIKEFPEIVDRELSVEEIIEISRELCTEKQVKKIHRSICENLEVIERNYKLMQLQETDISGVTKLQIFDKLEQLTSKLDKFTFKKQLAEDYLTEQFKYIDDWLLTTFNGLNSWNH